MRSPTCSSFRKARKAWRLRACCPRAACWSRAPATSSAGRASFSTARNPSCPVCHEGSAPADTRLPALPFEQARLASDEAIALGVERFAFTGGEPLILRGILDILAYAQRHRPCLVLTNGTAPLLRRAQDLARLREGAHPIAFRVSIDHPDEARHDAGRGYKMFRKAVEGLKLLHRAGFPTDPCPDTSDCAGRVCRTAPMTCRAADRSRRC